jgi:hypothetical protein
VKRGERTGEEEMKRGRRAAQGRKDGSSREEGGQLKGERRAAEGWKGGQPKTKRTAGHAIWHNIDVI